jgi:hypothetical protein
MLVIWKPARTLAVAGLVSLGISGGYAGEVQDIRLRDGSVIRAEIIELKNGVYTLRSPSLGTMRVRQSNVVGTGRGAAPAARSSGPPSTSRGIEGTREALRSNPEAMERIMSLKGDPDMRRILNNPKLMDALRRGDLQSLSNSPEIRKLMKNPAVRDLLRRGQ